MIQLKNFLPLLVIILLITSIVPYVFTGYWLLDILTHFKIQLSVVLLIAGIILLLRRSKKLFIALAVAGLFWNLYIMAPLFKPREDPIGNTEIRLVTINLLSSNTEYDKVAEYISSSHPDVIILLEYNAQWAEHLSSSLVDYRYNQEIRRRDNFGMAVYSKLEMKAEVVRQNAFPPMIRAYFLSQTQWELYAIHTFPPLGQNRFDLRNDQFQFLSENIGSSHSGIIVAGDFNSSSFSPHFRQFLSRTNLLNSSAGFGIATTWPSGYWPLQTTLDHILASDNILIRSHETGPDIGSDHLPVGVSFGFRSR